MTETNKNDQTIINDLADAMRRETTEAQKAYLAGEDSPSVKPKFFDWHAAIDNLKLTVGNCPWFSDEMAAQLRAVLHGIADKARKVGGRAAVVAKRALAFIFEQVKHYPETITVAVIMATLCYLVSSIPYIGWMLAPVINAVGVALVGIIFIGESVRYAKEAIVQTIR